MSLSYHSVSLGRFWESLKKTLTYINKGKPLALAEFHSSGCEHTNFEHSTWCNFFSIAVEHTSNYFHCYRLRSMNSELSQSSNITVQSSQSTFLLNSSTHSHIAENSNQPYFPLQIPVFTNCVYLQSSSLQKWEVCVRYCVLLSLMEKRK